MLDDGISELAQALSGDVQPEQPKNEPVAAQEVAPAPTTPQPPQGPSDSELLAFYRYKEKIRQDAIMADPLLPVKTALSNSTLAKEEQLALLRDIEELGRESGIEDYALLARITEKYAVPKTIKGKEIQAQQANYEEALNFKWLVDQYGEHGRRALEEFKTFARTEYGIGTPASMKHDLFRERFPAFLERKTGLAGAEVQAQVKLDNDIRLYEKVMRKH